MAQIELLPKARRVVVGAFSDDPLEAIEHKMTLEEVAAPDPSKLKDTDVIVEIRSAAVGWVDLLMSCGLYQHLLTPPYCPGLEYSGVVAWVGDAVDASKIAVGDAVIVDAFLAGPRSGSDYQSYGGFATYAVAPSKAIIPLPKGFSFDQGSNLLGNYETAYHCLVTCGGLQAGETVLIHGASGSTGLAAVHIARLLGATVIATGRSPEKLAVVAAQGAHHTIQTTNADDPNAPNWRDQVKALTNGQGVDVVYDGVGGDLSVETLRCVKFGARYLIVGWAATPFVANTKGLRGAPNANVLPTNLIMMKGLTVRGCPTVIATQKDPSIRKERLQQVLAWANEGKIQPYIDRTYPLEDFQEAMKQKWQGRVVGGITLHPQANQVAS
ncbi:MAG: NADPH:quinone oxidoreductase family protein [Myxococcales bacterium]|nr:NADPH:quinone oxidoreductase family protein [Myxococcales bacterium]